MSRNIIFYFSATGNSLHAAREIASATGDCRLVYMPACRLDTVPAGYERMGLVFPVYYAGLPPLVQRFLEGIRMESDSDTYRFTVVTRGGASGRCDAIVSSILAEKGVALSAAFTIPMEGNYVAMYNTPSENQKAYRRAEDVLRGVARDVRDKKGTPVHAKDLGLWRAFHQAYLRKAPGADQNFTVSAACAGCGTCARLCPVDNIEMRNGRPAYLGHCELCMACIQACPERAIDYGNKTRKRDRYRHPDVALADLLAQKKADGTDVPGAKD